MKTFKEYLTEAQKTYMVRIKVAGELPEGFESKLKSYMESSKQFHLRKLHLLQFRNIHMNFQDLKTWK